MITTLITLVSLTSLVLAEQANTTQPLIATKLGVAWDNNGNVSAWSQGKISWHYTWGPYKSSSDTEFVPMLWGPGQEGDFETQLKNGGFSGSTSVLGFNEPDNSGQSNLSPQEAADIWNQYLQPLAGKYQLGAPAVTSAPSGIPWLQQFFQACSGCRIDFIPIHWYGSSADAFESYVGQIHSTFNKPVWVTEWACVQYSSSDPPCDQQSVYDFMGQTTLFLDQQSYVQRYSWFGCRVGGVPDTDAILTTDGQSLTGLGNQYVIVGGHS
eukprot:TRINITY_DN1691_c0_g1_i1.p1 TRINITY_DN1691_c0_g1~~TRINITY_DN1691_c0_g1_i1.p1  ORF type:complete len:268 (+),score=54.44 TRINITY_DN1691_c0_g1_i1:103-906(+)